MSCLICRAIKMEVMSHSLTMAAGAAASPATALSRRGRSGSTSLSCYSSFPAPPSAGHHNHPASASHEASLKHQFLSLPRRTLIISGTMLLGLSLSEHSQNARAAARRPPPSPPEEKRDPNISGVQAKVLASKKRKEAMKQSMAKLRDKGSLIKQPSQ